MSTEIKVGDRRIFRSASAREIEIIEQLTDDPFAGEFRYRYTDNLGGTGILPAENLEMSSRPVPSTEAPQDHGPLAAHLSDRTLAKVLSRPAYVPRETPSLVELDRRDEMRALLAGAIWISTGGVGTLHDFGHTYAVDPFAAADAILARFDVRSVQS